ncbi:MAG: hypothetical protein ACSHXF_03745 [Aquaticitalea sp.]
MNYIDTSFFTVFNHYKAKHKKKANDIALIYVLLLQASVIMLFGAFIMLFLDQMHVGILSSSKSILLFVLILFVLLFRNWIYYTGKNRKVLNTNKSKARSDKASGIYVIWLIPVVCFALSIVILQRI